MINYEKYTHYDTEIEAAVIGVLLLESDAYARISASLEPVHFYDLRHQQVFTALTEMWKTGYQIDLLTVNSYMMRRKCTIETLAYFLCSLTGNVVSNAHLETHAVIVRQYYAERECLRIQAEAGSGGGDAIGRMFKMQDDINRILNLKSTDDWRDMSEVMLSLHRHMESVKGKKLLGVPTGFNQLDKYTYGLQGGQLVVVGARPSVGKSAFANQLALNAARNNYQVGIISLEMPETQVGARIAALYSDIEFWRIYRNRMNDPGQEDMFLRMSSDIASLPIRLSDKTNVSASDIRSKAYKLHKKGQLNLLIIDYLQLIEGEGKSSDNREREVAKLSRSLKLLAMDLNIPVILLCQLNRDSEKSINKKPKLQNLRESGAIEQDADLVMLLHRDWKAGVLVDSMGNTTEFKANLIIEKNRNGECIEIELGFNPDRLKFHDLEPSFTPIAKGINHQAQRDRILGEVKENMPF